MKQRNLTETEQLLLRKRAIIESVNDELKKYLQTATHKASFNKWISVLHHGYFSSLLLLSKKAFT